jgi:hypothetical protein
MTYVTLFPPQGKTLNFENVTDLAVANGVLTFYARKDLRSRESQKIVTNLPFMCTENVGSGSPIAGITA